MSTRQLKESERNLAATIYIGNIDEEADEDIIYEFALQAGPLVNVNLPRDRVNQEHQGFGFVEYKTERDAEYAAQILNGIMLYGKPLRINRSSAEKAKQLDIGAELFVGNLDPLVDEKVLHDTFSTFGRLIAMPKIVRDSEGQSRGFGFVSFDDFESSDKAIEAMNDQFLMNRPCHISYAFKKDGKGERHGEEAERLLAAEAKKHNYSLALPSAPPIQFPRSSRSGGDSGGRFHRGDGRDGLQQQRSGANAIPTGPRKQQQNGSAGQWRSTNSPSASSGFPRGPQGSY